MNKEALNNHIRTLLLNDNLEGALADLSTYVKGLDQDLENLLLIRTGGLKRLRNNIRLEIEREADAKRGLAQVRNVITQILEDVPERGNDVITTPSGGKRKILFMSASPDGESRLRVDKELRLIKDSLAAASLRERFNLLSEPAVTIPTISRALQKEKPEIVHFSGHGVGEAGLLVEGREGDSVLIPTAALANLFSLFKGTIKCVVLNACYAAEQAEAISKHGIYVLGMNDEISDSAAIDFSQGFYQSLGEGNDYKFAFKIAMFNNSANLNDAATPEIWLDGAKLD